MKTLSRMSLALVLLTHRTAAAETASHDVVSLATTYLERRQATMQDNARPEDVDKALSSCTASLVYEHPRVGIKLTGVEAIRSGMVQFLGASRNARIEIVSSLRGTDMAAVQTRVSFEAQDGATWTAVERQQVWVFEFEGSKIKRIIEYW